jgi:hypothetical protein
MQYNYRQEYNILYLKLLKEIHLIEKDEEALAIMLPVLVPFTFEFDDYLFVKERLTGEERKKWQAKMLAKSRNVSSPYKKAATVFFFKLADTEKTYRKMIDYIDSDTPYSIILQYFESMVLTDKNRLLEAILRKTEDYGWNQRRENDEAYFPELFKLFVKYYQADYLKMVISSAEKGRLYFRPNNLIVYIKQQLSE